jgi:putative SOS response-associated peptidase YedK
LPGRFFLTATVPETAGHFAATHEIGAADLGPEFAPGELVPAVIAGGGGRRLVAMRWGMIPMGRRNARGRPVLDTIVNARSETLFAKAAFAGLRRCLLPASGWYEWSGTGRQRTLWTVRWPSMPILAVAAVWDLWTGPNGSEVASLASVTCAPTVEVAAVHDRMPVILAREVWPVWLGEAAGDPAPTLAPLADGLLLVERADGRPGSKGSRRRL